MVRPTYDPSLTKHDFMFMQPHLVNTSYRASFAYTTWTSLVIGHHLCTIFPSWLSFDHKGAPLHIQVVQSQPFQKKINGAPRSWSTSQRLVTYQSGCDSELGYERTTSERSSTHFGGQDSFWAAANDSGGLAESFRNNYIGKLSKWPSWWAVNSAICRTLQRPVQEQCSI